MDSNQDSFKYIQKSRERERKSYVSMRMVKDITMSLLILGMAFLMLLGDKFHATYRLVANTDPAIRYSFGGLCVLYGGFRLYRSIKRDY